MFLNTVTNRGSITLSLAAEHNHLEVVRSLVSKSANVNLADFDGNTPLIWAVNAHWASMVKLLLQFGFDISAQNGEQKSAFHYAV